MAAFSRRRGNGDICQGIRSVSEVMSRAHPGTGSARTSGLPRSSRLPFPHALARPGHCWTEPAQRSCEDVEPVGDTPKNRSCDRYQWTCYEKLTSRECLVRFARLAALSAMPTAKRRYRTVYYQWYPNNT